MTKDTENLYTKLAETKLLPLYTANDLSYLPKLEEILVKHDVRFIEVTFRSALAAEAIKQLAASGDLIVGAGTVRTLAEAKTAVENGAQFIVSPALVDDVIQYCQENDIPVFPGTATPRDIQTAFEYGINVVKFFPANIYGGIDAINALKGPYYDMKFLPTGGVNADNLLEYLDNDAVIGVGGSFIISENAIIKDNGESADRALGKLLEKIK